ncbi:MAG: hypothetical protein AAFN11_15490, partial [Chloroflexota bacterium]
SVGEIITLEPCITIPSEDSYHLRLLVTDVASGQYLNLLENSQYWGHYLILGRVQPPSASNLSNSP